MDEPSHIHISVTTKNFAVKKGQVQKLGHIICAHLGVETMELAIQLVGNTRIRHLNRTYRGKDRATDVLSFPQMEWGKPKAVRSTGPRIKKVTRRPSPRAAATASPKVPLGDLVISLPKALENAQDIGQSLDQELAFLLVHGILHLCGHDHVHQDDERVMLKNQRKLMKILAQGASGDPLWRGCVRLRKKRGTA